MPWRIIKYLAHLFYLRHRKGHGIHSPYLFEFIHRVVFDAENQGIPSRISLEHRRLKKDHGPGGGDGRTVSSFVRHSSVSEKKGALLHRIARWFHPEMMVELGTGLGISSLYLATGSPGTQLHTIEGNTERATFAAHLVNRCQLGPVSIHWGDMQEKLDDILPLMPDRFLAYVDGDHHYDPTLNYVRLLMERAGEEAVIVLDDIYWSRGMYRAWQEIIGWPESRVSIDLYEVGIVLLRKDLNKAQMKIKF